MDTDLTPPEGVDDTDVAVIPPPSPTGTFALRRLNRDEYDLTLAELLGTSLRPGRSLPAEPQAGGFDNTAEALTITPVWFDLVDRAAGDLAAELVRPPLVAPWAWASTGAAAGFQTTGPENGPYGAALALRSTSTATLAFTPPVAGRYTLTLDLRAIPAGADGAEFLVSVDGVGVIDGVIERDELGVQAFTAEIRAGVGASVLAISFDNDYVDAVTELDRDLFIEAVRIEGPVDWTDQPTESHRRWMTCALDGDAPRDCAVSVIMALLPKAWRRPPEAVDADRIVGVYDAVIALGEPPQAALEAAIHAILVSPRFLMVIEQAASPSAEAQPVDGWEMASRLSYFLWESMPDDALFAAAAEGRLDTPEGVEAEAIRMLADPRSEVLVQTFAGQWLGLHRFDAAQPHDGKFGEWSPELRLSMRGEMETFFRTFLYQERPLTELLTATEGYADATLAAFLGVPHEGDGFAPYDATVVRRGGWLAQAGWLTALSHSDRTSPVRRGAWVLGALLCDEPDPPPPGIPALAETNGSAVNTRAILAEHRANPACAGCHDAIDPIGLAMERWDPIGRYRPAELQGMIDESGGLPDGTPVVGITELQRAIAADPAFLRCATEKLYTWAHHRVPGPDDAAWIEALTTTYEADGGSLGALIRAIVRSPTFRSREVRP